MSKSKAPKCEKGRCRDSSVLTAGRAAACRIRACFGTSTEEVGPWPSSMFSALKRRAASLNAPKSSCGPARTASLLRFLVLSKIVSGCLRSYPVLTQSVKKSGAKMRVSDPDGSYFVLTAGQAAMPNPGLFRDLPDPSRSLALVPRIRPQAADA